MSAIDRILKDAQDLAPSVCLYDASDDDWCEGFEQGVRFALGEVRNQFWELSGPADAMKTHHPVHDAIPRCRCGSGFATDADLWGHISDEVLDAVTPEALR